MVWAAALMLLASPAEVAVARYSACEVLNAAALDDHRSDAMTIARATVRACYRERTAWYVSAAGDRVRGLRAARDLLQNDIDSVAHLVLKTRAERKK